MAGITDCHSGLVPGSRGRLSGACRPGLWTPAQAGVTTTFAQNETARTRSGPSCCRSCAPRLREASPAGHDLRVVADGGRACGDAAIGKAGATREEIEEAARRANCHEFVSRMPEGYNTLVGENGSTLSGGERQRIAIARALLKDAPIILLDEATASLDPENELEIQEALSQLIQNKTVVVIAHRLRTIAGADNIVVLENGQIAEQGPGPELLASGGLYARLFGIQKKTIIKQLPTI